MIKWSNNNLISLIMNEFYVKKKKITLKRIIRNLKLTLQQISLITNLLFEHFLNKQALLRWKKIAFV